MASVVVGETLDLTVALSAGFDPGYYAVIWSTDDEAVATVVGDNAGATVTGVGAGTATITAEVKAVSYSSGSPVYTSLSTPLTDTLSVETLGLYTVTYNLNGGNIDAVTDPVVVENVVGGTLVGSAYTGGTPVKALNTWTTPYWVTTAEGSTDAASTAVTADVTVYAYWVAD